MTKHFTLKELTASAVARRQGIDNTPTEEALVWLDRLADTILRPLREAYGKPLLVTSAYRSPRLNAAMKGACGSQHILGQAADIKVLPALLPADAKSYTLLQRENRRLFNLIIDLGLPFDQLIDEKEYSWLHVSVGPQNRRETIHR